MAKSKKSKVRINFRTSVFERDGYSCRKCGVHPGEVGLAAHHITSRDLMPGGGYVLENGITLCDPCHVLAEQRWSTGTAAPGFSQEDLYACIGSSFDKALVASEALQQVLTEA